MINLLPYDIKKQMRAARMNTILIRYIILSGFAVAFLILACATTYFFIPIIFSVNNNTNSNKTLSSSNVTIQSQANAIVSNLSTANSILNQQVMYSTILTNIASALPTGTMLESLSLSDASFGNPVNLKILAISSNLEPTIKQNFSSQNLFSDYKLQSVTDNGSSSSKYKKIININIAINKGATQ